MPQFRTVRKKPELEIERLDGGLNKKDSPSRVSLNESPDCLNVVFGDRGSAETRQGTSYYNSAAVNSSAGDGGHVYNGTAVVWYGGQMYRMSGTMAVAVTAASGKFASGAKVAYQTYQDIMFCSDGTNGPWRWEGEENFYNMGISAPSATATPTSDTSGGGDVAADTYYYAVSFVNTHVVEGEVGSASAGVTLGASASIDITGVPTGAGIQGVDKRNVYRATATSGPWLFVKELDDNTTTSFSDNIAVGSEGAEAPDDASSPSPFSAIKLHKERLWMPDNTNPTLLTYTEYDVPFISKAANFLLLHKGDGSDIVAIGVQNDLVTAMKGQSIFLVAANDPADDTTFQVVKSPANYGITGSRAFIEEDNGIIFAAKRNGRFVGFGYLSGLDLIDTQNNFMINNVISEKIETDLLSYPSSLWDDISMTSFNNRVYIAVPATSSSTRIDGMLNFDINRLVPDQDTAPGSWAPWDGVVGVHDFFVLDGALYGVGSDTDGRILSFENGTYTDADGSAINSYWWSKLIGGESGIESWVKDWRHILPWFERLGSYNMKMRVRLDGDTGSGNAHDIDLTPGGSLWDTALWNIDLWGGGLQDTDAEVPIGPMLGKRIQVRFDNDDTAGQGFKVHGFKIRFNMRRQR